MGRVVAAIIGAGGIADYHIRGYLKAGVEVRAIVDVVKSAAELQAQKHKIDKVFTDYQVMLEECPEVTSVSICIPNKYHAAVAIDALNHGKHVFCEKPPALNAQEALKMKEAAEKNHRVLMFDFNNRARPEIQALIDYVRTNEIGTINSAQAMWVRRRGIPGFGGWFTQKALSGGGSTIDLIHAIDLALYFMDYPEPEWVLAQTFCSFFDNPDFKGPWGGPVKEGGVVDVETASHSFIRFSTGQVLFARTSWAEMNKREEVSVTFQGTKGGGMMKRLFKIDGMDETVIDSCEIYTMEHRHPVNKKIIVEKDEKWGREKTVSNFVNSVLGKEEPLSNPSQAVTLMKIIDGIYASAEKRTPIGIT